MGEVGNFLGNAFGVPTAFSSAGKGHYTKCAHVVTPTGNGHKGADAIGIDANGGNVAIGFFFGKNNVDSITALIDFSQEIGQVFVGIGTYDHVDNFFFFEELVLQAFGHAAQHPNFHLWVALFYRVEFFEAFADGLLGFFTNGAGVDQNQISLIERGRCGIAFLG